MPYGKGKVQWVPSRKWFAAQAVALGGLATSAIDSGWDATEWKLLVGIGVQAALTYALPNGDDTPTRSAVKRKVAHVESRDRRS